MADSSTTDGIVEYLSISSRFRNAPVPDGWVTGSYDDFVLLYGHSFTLVVPDDLERGELGNCYENAARYCLDLNSQERFSGEFHYCAVSPNLPIPIPHAWVVDNYGHAIDPTWNYPEVTYFGVPWLCDNAWARMVKVGRFGIIQNDWHPSVNNDLLRNGVPLAHTPEPYRKEHHG